MEIVTARSISDFSNTDPIQLEKLDKMGGLYPVSGNFGEKFIKNGTGQPVKYGKRDGINPCVLDPERRNPSAFIFLSPAPAAAARCFLRPSPLHCRRRYPQPSSTAASCPFSPPPAPGLPFTAWRRHHRRGNPLCAARACWEFTVPFPFSLGLSSLLVVLLPFLAAKTG